MMIAAPPLTRVAGLVLAACLLARPLPAPAQQADPAAAASQGAIADDIDATDLRSRLDLRWEFWSLQNAGTFNLIVPRVQYAPSGALAVRVALPIVITDPDDGIATGETGTGDAVFDVTYRALRRDGGALFVGSNFSFDTATRRSLGFGKYLIAPFVSSVIEIPGTDSAFIPRLQYSASVGGRRSRDNVSTLSLKTGLRTSWGQGIYSILDPVMIVDLERSARVGATVEFELGRSMRPDLVLYVRPGIGLLGDNLPQVYNWNVEAGIRYFF